MKSIQITIAALALLLSSCSVTVPFAVTNNAIGDKIGTSETTIIFGGAGSSSPGIGMYVTNKKYGVVDAIKDGDLSTVATVDIKVTNFLIFTKAEIIVTGE